MSQMKQVLCLFYADAFYLILLFVGNEIANLSQECIIYKMRVYFYISTWDNCTTPYKYLILDGIWPRIANNYDFPAT